MVATWLPPVASVVRRSRGWVQQPQTWSHIWIYNSVEISLFNEVSRLITIIQQNSVRQCSKYFIITEKECRLSGSHLVFLKINIKFKCSYSGSVKPNWLEKSIWLLWILEFFLRKFCHFSSAKLWSKYWRGFHCKQKSVRDILEFIQTMLLLCRGPGY